MERIIRLDDVLTMLHTNDSHGGEVDSDLLVTEGVAGIDVIIGGHSHSFINPSIMVTSDINTGDLAVEPDGNNVASLTLDGVPVNFADAGTTYNVSTMNYVAAGSCSFSDSGVTLWPLDQIVADTQFYVRDSVIDYMQAQTDPINPGVGGRLLFPAL